jgi:hypothetical protein
LSNDYKPDKLDKYILKRWGPKGKYLKSSDVPDTVRFVDFNFYNFKVKTISFS